MLCGANHPGPNSYERERTALTPFSRLMFRWALNLALCAAACHTASWYLNPKNVRGGSGGIYAIAPKAQVYMSE